MLTESAARKIFLSMPNAEEREHMGHPDFRVANKIFGSLRPDDGCAMVKMDLDDQEAAVKAMPKIFSLNGWSYTGATDIHLAHVTAARFRKLVAESWRRTAPKKMVEDEGELARRKKP